jgi:hypothetical protein
MSTRAGRDVAIGLGAGILGALANEHLSARPRIEQAARVGYSRGWTQRDTELRPQLARISGENVALRSEVEQLRQQLQLERSGVRILASQVLAAVERGNLPEEIEISITMALPPGSA